MNCLGEYQIEKLKNKFRTMITPVNTLEVSRIHWSKVTWSNNEDYSKRCGVPHRKI